MSTKEIIDALVERGRKVLDAPIQLHQFTRVPEADSLLNDLDRHPHAFVFACVMDRQIRAERAWLIPYQISVKLGGFSMKRLKQLSVSEVNHVMSHPEPLHRFVDMMSRHLHSAIQHISGRYADDANKIWKGKPSSAEVVYRFLEFDGVGPKIATMAVNILARRFKIPFADHFSVDISADVHVRRVFGRLGLCPADATIEQVIYRARALHPEFPGIMDFPCWEIGREWCKTTRPDCDNCYMQRLCLTGTASISPPS